MKLKLSSKKFRLTQDVTDRVEQKLEKLNKFFPEDTACVVNFTQQKNDVRVEITIQHRGVMFRAEVADREYLNALDRAQENILRQIRKNRTELFESLKAYYRVLILGEDVDTVLADE